MTVPDTMQKVTLVSDRAGWGRELAASLPRSLEQAGDAAGDLIIVDGAEDWALRATSALEQGARALVIVEPVAASLAAVSALADAVDEAGASAALICALADNAATGEYADLLDGSFGELVLDGARKGGLDTLLLSQLRLLRMLGLAAPRFEPIGNTSGAFIIEGEGQLRGERLLLRLTGSVGGGPGHLSVTAHSPTATARLAWRGDAPARPVDVTLADAAGLRVLPAIHEGGHRRALRQLLGASAIQGGSEALRLFGQDLDLTKTLLGAP